MNSLAKWVEEKIDYLDDRLESMEDSYEDIGSSMYLQDPEVVVNRLLKGSETHMLQNLYKYGKEDFQARAMELLALSWRFNAYNVFIEILLEHYHSILTLEREQEEKVGVPILLNTDNDDEVIDNEHY